MQENSQITKDEVEDDLIQRIYDQKWKYAKTYDTKAPHEYILMEWNEQLFRDIAKWIRDYGEDHPYYRTLVRYGFIGNYRYWHYNTMVHDSIMNRARNVPTHMGMNNYSEELRAQYMKNTNVIGEA